MRNKGYTLPEMLVYISLVTLLLLVIIETALSLGEAHKRSRAYLDINSSAISAFSRFSRDIRKSTSVDTINSTLDASSGKLALLMKKSDGTNDATTFYLSSGTVKVEENGVYQGDITPSGMEVSNLTFRKFSLSTTTAIRIEMTLAPDASSSVPALNFYDTYVMRGSYVQ